MDGTLYPAFGPEISCPQCRLPIPGLILTETYLCNRHGAFEADMATGELVHVQSGRRWRRWQDEWYRQHVHPDGLRFEIHYSLDDAYRLGQRVSKIQIAERYRTLLQGCLERQGQEERLFGLQVEFGTATPAWEAVNFRLVKAPGHPQRPRWKF
jgi:uncharacterized protein (TIGR02652 family)